MKVARFVHTFTVLQNFPRWDEHAPKFSDNTASHSFRVAMYILHAAWREQKVNGNEIDILKAVCRGLFHDMNESKTGPIKHVTKKNPKVQGIIKKLEIQASEEIVSYLPENMQEIFYDYLVNAEDDTFEGKMVDGIDTFDALMFCKREIMYGSNRFFKKTYEELLEKLKKHELESIRWLTKQVEEETTYFQMLLSIMMMDRVRRWKGKFNMIYDDDAIHTFRATALGIFNAYYEKLEHGKEIDMLELVSKILCHDLVEEWVGDVLGPVKHSTPETKKEFEEYERDMAIAMSNLLPDYLKEEFKEYMANAKSSDYIGELVDIADKLDALMKANMERHVNRISYEFDYRQQRNKIEEKFTNPCIRHFLDIILPDLDYPVFTD